jgi:hypothetical protein
VCGSEPFAWFVAHLLAQLPQFLQAYNDVLDAYRREHGIRSAARPVPDLAKQGEWLEAPLWIWTTRDPRRRRLFACPKTTGVVLSDRQHFETVLPLKQNGEYGHAVAQLLDLGKRGFKIRSRALITTLWARLALGDLFLHGIGGAKYDQVTDALVSRFYGLDPPEFLVVTATMHLPIRRRRTTADDLRAIDHRLRELTWHPELYINSVDADPARRDAGLADLIAAKKKWIATKQTPENARERFREFRRINRAMQPWVASQRANLQSERKETVSTLQAEQVISSREYAFCLFPEETLRSFMEGLLRQDA